MLCKPFSEMSSSVGHAILMEWSGRIHLPKIVTGNVPLWSNPVTICEKDKMFAWQYNTATDRLKYHIAVLHADLKQCSNSTLIRNVQQQPIKDTHLAHQTRNSTLILCRERKTKGKGKCKPDNTEEETKEGTKKVEVLYVDGKWYRGWLSSFNFNMGKWKAATILR